VPFRAIIADAHLGEQPGDLERFGAQLDDLAHRDVQDLTLLGDTFAYLIGDRRFLGGVVAAVLERLAGFRRGGRRVHLIEGNRDFFVRGSVLAREHLDSVRQVRVFTTGGRRYLLVHGDLVDPYDHRYRFWRFVAKNPGAYLAMRALPGWLGRAIVRRAERQLRGLSPAGAPFDRLALASYARARFAAGVDRVVIGHYHEYLRFADGARDLIALPAWRDTGAVALVAPSGALAVEGAAASARERVLGLREHTPLGKVVAGHTDWDS